MSLSSSFRRARTVVSFVAFATGLALLSRTAPASGDEPPTFADRTDEEVDDSTRSIAFMFNPLATSAGVLGAEADFVLAKRLVVEVEGDVYALGGNAAMAIGAGLLVYPLRTAFHGLYVEPRAVFARSLGESLIEVNWNTDVAGLGVVAGWQWTWDSGFSVRGGAGAMQYIGGNVNSAPRGAALDIGSAQLVLDASLGWTF